MVFGQHTRTPHPDAAQHAQTSNRHSRDNALRRINRFWGIGPRGCAAGSRG
jgi:hypothetical protein